MDHIKDDASNNSFIVPSVVDALYRSYQAVA
jgi:hypothetical protein